MNPDFTVDLLQHLRDLRYFPKYQYERRIDAFVGFFLLPVLRAQAEIGATAHLVPEFPLKADDEWRLSNNADYVVLEGQGNAAVLVELKTDAGSVDRDQLAYYTRALFTPWPELVQDIRWIMEGSRERVKYQHLLGALECLTGVPSIRAVFLAPQSAAERFEKELASVARDMTLEFGEVASRWRFMSFGEFAATQIETPYQDAWRAVANELGRLK